MISGKSISLIMVFAFCHILSASEISISGTVKNSEGAPLEGVKISLSSIAVSPAVSDVQGAFSLSATGCARNNLPILSKTDLKLEGRRIIISHVDENIDGKLELFSVNGSRIASYDLKNSTAGKLVIDLPNSNNGLQILRLRIQDNVITKSLVYNRTGRSCQTNSIYNSDQVSAAQIHTSANAYIIADTIIAVKSGYVTQKVPLESYTQKDINIIMPQAQTNGEMPLVYSTEDSVGCTLPDLVSDPTTLPPITYLPDPFLFADGKTRMQSKDEWRCRRAQIKAMIEKYGTGEKPPKPEKFEASLSNNTITMKCGVGSNSITLTATISRPSGAPSTPIPAIIGINGPTGSLPAAPFSNRGIATITFSSDQIMANGFSSTARSSGNFAKLYPQNNCGSMVRWAWGVSRIIDALEALPEAKIDLRHIAVSGCSYQGKIALYSGAFDERIALTIPHESGGGGTISWRYSDMLEDRDNTEVENLHHAQGAPWYAEVLSKYIPPGVSPNSLPYDQHELIALIAPRAVLCIESSMIARMGAEAARADALAAREIWKALGVPDRMGAAEESTNHCVWASGYTKDLEAFLDKFMLGKSDVNTDILRSKFTSVDRSKWIPWETPTLK